MRFKLILTLLILFIQTLAFAGLRCDLLKKLEHPSLADKSEFWAEYSELSGKGKLNDRTLSELIDKHSPGLNSNSSGASSAAAAEFHSPIRTSTSKRATKEIEALPTTAMKKNFEEFMTTVTGPEGVQGLYKNPGRWHMEKIKAFSEGNVFSVRLNNGYRVLFKFEKNELTIMEVNRNNIHNI